MWYLIETQLTEFDATNKLQDAVHFKRIPENGTVALAIYDHRYYLYMEFWEKDKILFELGTDEFKVIKLGENPQLPKFTKDNLIYSWPDVDKL